MTTAADLLPEGWQRWDEPSKIRLLRTLETAAVPDWYTNGARPEQVPPASMWDMWLILAGRGFGKTRTGAEWSVRKARDTPGARGALVAPIVSDTRDVLVEGESGILAVAPPNFTPHYEPSKRRLTYPRPPVLAVGSGVHVAPEASRQYLYSADEPDRLRGPQHDHAWVDEWAAMRRGEALMDMLELGLRLGDHPQVCVTTTPRPLPWLRAVMKAEHTEITGGSTYDNLANLAPTFRRRILAKFEGTRLGRQELHAELLLDVEGALWDSVMLEHARDKDADLDSAVRVVVGIDPAVTSNPGSDETGIVVVALLPGGEYAVLEDCSGRYSPAGWARAAADAAGRHGADIVAEVNNGGDLVGAVVQEAAPWAKVKQVRASKGKATRAEPVVMLYEQGRVAHLPGLALLEDQMASWVPGIGESPDRVDALVWAVTELTTRPLRPARSFST